jgi:DNA-binding NtrC family response regulator
MQGRLLIVEDEFIVANDLSLMLKKAGYEVCGIAASVTEARAMVEKHEPEWVLLDIFLKDGSKGIELADYLTGKKIGFVYISANTNERILEMAKATQPYGFLVKPFREKDLLIMLEIAQARHQQQQEFELQRELMLKKQISYLIESKASIHDKFLKGMPGVLQAIIPFDYLRIITFPKNGAELSEKTFLRLSLEEYQVLERSELAEVLNGSIADLSGRIPRNTGVEKPVFYNETEFRRYMFNDPLDKALNELLNVQSKLSFPIVSGDDTKACMFFYSTKPANYNSWHLNLLANTELLLSKLVGHLTQKDTGNMPYSPGESDQEGWKKAAPKSFEGIIGESPNLLKVLDHISLVSQSDITVLITGESGTGKEKVAQYIHKLSSRKNKQLVTVNCAALPFELIESELFGHEKGAYTGAAEKRIGKFEQANGGTIFLDEIGEMPLDAQVKLLRVLQEKEIDRVGGKQGIKVDVRVIAATNKKLEKEVAEGRFRLDLYYRLNVYPIEVPSLRDRKQDIPLLAEHFLSSYEKEIGRKITGFSPKANRQMQSYDWPGNIRELGHLVQRAMIVAEGSIIQELDLPNLGFTTSKNEVSAEGDFKTLEQVEADHILGILKGCGGKVCGDGGAAQILGLPPSTLNSKIKKLGIKRESYYNL